jgi:hypothetical protein
MRTKIVLIVSVCALTLFSCKIDKEEKEIDINSVKKGLTNSKIKVTLEAIVPKDDIFQIYYTNDGTPNCSEELSVKAAVVGSDKKQKIVFNLPEDSAMLYLRIDPGQNPDQGTMKFFSFQYDYFGKKFDIIGSDFFNNFIPTEHLEMNFKEATLTPTGKGEKYDPVLYGQPPFAPRLKEILLNK